MSGACSRKARSSSGTKLYIARADEADRQPADLAALDAPRLARRVLDGVEDLARAHEERRPGRGQLDLALVAQQQLRADLLLELADLLAQRRLGHVQALRRAAEVQLLGDGDEVAQVSELHGSVMMVGSWTSSTHATA